MKLTTANLVTTCVLAQQAAATVCFQIAMAKIVLTDI
jgi:hypothetical protein